MELYGGIDLHGNNNVIVLADKSNRVEKKKRLSNNISEVLWFLEPYRERIVGLAVESTYNWYWLADGLMDADYQVHLANPAAMQQYSGLKYSDDNTDARWIAHMLALGILPEGYIYPKDERPVRDLLRKRTQLVQFRTSNLLSINNLITRNTGKSKKGNEIKKLTEGDIIDLFGEENLALAANSNLAVMQCLEKHINTIEKRVRKIAKLRPQYKNLLTVNGIGDILALTIALETGDINRFEKAGRYSSYCRCVKSERQSNGKKKGKGNSKNGNKHLAWAFIEAATFAVRFSEYANRFYRRKKSKGNEAIAKKALANKLSKACFYIIRDNVPFDEKRCFAT